MKDLNELRVNKDKISEPFMDEKGNMIRLVDGKEIIQIKEDTEEKIRLNNAINLWRMRAK